MSFFDELKALWKRPLKSKTEPKPCPCDPLRAGRRQAIRENLNITQSEMAKVLGTSLDTIKSWETGRRNPTGLAAKCWPPFRLTRNSFMNWRRIKLM
jgi:DNA-binding transcriptional regulator YiaG